MCQAIRASAVRIVLSLLLCAISASYGAQAAGLDYVNQLRASAGMAPLYWRAELADGAQAHADYLAANPITESGFFGGSAHRESPGLQGFTGVAPADRALQQGYPHGQVLENVSSGSDDVSDAIDGLMGAIYHRLGFLDFAIDELGSGRNARQFVFLMGRGDLRELCWSPQPDALVTRPVQCGDSVVSSDFIQQLCEQLPPQALMRQPWPVACSNGQRLDNDFMQSLCRDGFPVEAQLRGKGRYYALCDPPRRVRAAWFDGFCEATPAPAAYTRSGRYIEMCEPPRRVDADWLERRCANLDEAERYTDSGRYVEPCEDTSIQVRVEAMDDMQQAQWQRNPDVVMWPPDQAANIPPAFFEEDPDPLPDRSVSGYPISIQFNPASTAQVESASFRLLKWSGNGQEFSWKAVADTRVLDQDTDPQEQLDGLQFVLFPLQRLDWAGRYRAEFEAWVDGEYRQYAWDFATSDPGGPLFVIDGSDQVMRVDVSERPLVVIPPRREAYSVNALKVAWQGDTEVSISSLDGNTARLDIDWRNCLPVKLTVEDGRSATIRRKDCR